MEEPGPNRPGNAHDGEAFRGHIKTTIRSIFKRITGSNTAPGTHKERIPGALKKGYKDLIKSTPKSLTAGGQNLRELLSQNKPTSSSGGMRIMSQNLDQAIGLLQGSQAPGSQETLTALKAFKSANLHGTGEQDHMNLRFGSEVIFSQQELKTGFNNTMKTTVGELAQQITSDVDHGVLMGSLQQELIDGAKSDDSTMQINEHGVAESFHLDFVQRGDPLSIDGHSIPWEADPEITGTEDTGTRRLSAMKDLFGDNTQAMALMSKITNQMSHASVQLALTGFDKGGALGYGQRD
ncbi:MAG: hypothetical protein HUN05_00155 [Desulfobacter sp.]|nr:MAG: hypothetical protein HUN05_00155 [Desulfobacter sp.]